MQAYSIIDTIRYVVGQSTGNQPQSGTIYAINGNTIDVSVRGSAVIIRNLPVVGDVNSLYVGQYVDLRWQGTQVVAIAVPTTGTVPISVSINPDGSTLENSPVGLRVKANGLQLWHLAFTPALAGHTHMDSMQRAGWHTDDDGAVFQNNVHIHPSGQISLGSDPDIIKLDASHATYRMWAGSVDPDQAGFAVEKDGSVHIRRGDITLGTGDDVLVASSSDDDWRLWIGDDDPEAAPFRVNKYGQAWLDSANVSVELQSTNYVEGLTGWKLDQTGRLEANDAVIRGKITSTVFERETISAISGRLVVTEAGVLVSDVGNTDETIVVDHQAFGAGDVVHLKSTTRQEWMAILDDGTPVDGGIEYSVERDVDGDGAEVWYTGEAVFREGNAVLSEQDAKFGAPSPFGTTRFGGSAYKSSGGFLKLEGAAEEGPYFGVSRRIGPEYNQVFDAVRIGNLAEFLDVQDDHYGIGVGDLSRFFRYTYEDGLLIRTSSGGTQIDDNGITTDSLIVLPSDVPEFQDGQAQLYVNGDEIRVHYKNGAYETDTLLNKLDGQAPVLKSDSSSDRIVQVVLNGSVALTTSDSATVPVPSSMNGMILKSVSARCGTDQTSGASTSGTIEISVQNGTTNMLTTNLTIDVGEYSSANAATPAVIDENNDGVITGDEINVEVVQSGTGAKKVVVTLVFGNP